MYSVLYGLGGAHTHTHPPSFLDTRTAAHPTFCWSINKQATHAFEVINSQPLFFNGSARFQANRTFFHL